MHLRVCEFPGVPSLCGTPPGYSGLTEGMRSRSLVRMVMSTGSPVAGAHVKRWERLKPVSVRRLTAICNPAGCQPLAGGRRKAAHHRLPQEHLHCTLQGCQSTSFVRPSVSRPHVSGEAVLPSLRDGLAVLERRPGVSPLSGLNPRLIADTPPACSAHTIDTLR